MSTADDDTEHDPSPSDGPKRAAALQLKIDMLEQQLSALKSKPVQQKTRPGTSSVISDLRTLNKIHQRHHNFVEKWSHQPNATKTLRIEESLMDFALRAFDEFKETYREYLPDDIEKALQPPPSKKNPSDENPSKRSSDDEPPPPLKKHSASKRKRDAKNEIANREEEEVVQKKRTGKPPM